MTQWTTKFLQKSLGYIGLKGATWGGAEVSYQIGSSLEQMVTNKQIWKLLHAKFLNTKFWDLYYS